MINELPIPPVAAKSNSALEIVRVWAAEGEQHVSLATELWEDPAAWGLLLADLARHVAKSYAASAKIDEGSALRRIQEALNVELTSPTDQPTGGIIE